MNQELSDIFVNWQDKLEQDEWYFSHAFNSITMGMSPGEAFDYIPYAIQAILSLEHDFLIWNTLYFLISLYSIAQTTELHNELKINWKELSAHVANYNDSFSAPFQELKRILRIRDI